MSANRRISPPCSSRPQHPQMGSHEYMVTPYELLQHLPLALLTHSSSQRSLRQNSRNCANFDPHRILPSLNLTLSTSCVFISVVRYELYYFDKLADYTITVYLYWLSSRNLYPNTVHTFTHSRKDREINTKQNFTRIGFSVLSHTNTFQGFPHVHLLAPSVSPEIISCCALPRHSRRNSQPFFPQIFKNAPKHVHATAVRPAVPQNHFCHVFASARDVRACFEPQLPARGRTSP